MKGFQGARMHAAYIRPGGVAFGFAIGALCCMISLLLLLSLVKGWPRLKSCFQIICIWKQRLVDVGVVSYGFGCKIWYGRV